MALRDDIQDALNRASAENESNTPDFILAGFLTHCLSAFDGAVTAREAWYGRDPNAGPAGITTPPAGGTQDDALKAWVGEPRPIQDNPQA